MTKFNGVEWIMNTLVYNTMYMRMCVCLLLYVDVFIFLFRIKWAK